MTGLISLAACSSLFVRAPRNTRGFGSRHAKNPNLFGTPGCRVRDSLSAGIGLSGPSPAWRRHHAASPDRERQRAWRLAFRTKQPWHLSRRDREGPGAGCFTAGRGHAGFAGLRAARHRGGDFRIRSDGEGGGRAVESGAGGAGQIIAEDFH